MKDFVTLLCNRDTANKRLPSGIGMYDLDCFLEEKSVSATEDIVRGQVTLRIGEVDGECTVDRVAVHHQ